MWGGNGTPTQPTPIFKFCVIGTLPVPEICSNYLLRLTLTLTKQTQPCQLRSALKCKTNTNYQQMVYSVLY